MNILVYPLYYIVLFTWIIRLKCWNLLYIATLFIIIFHFARKIVMSFKQRILALNRNLFTFHGQPFTGQLTCSSSIIFIASISYPIFFTSIVVRHRGQVWMCYGFLWGLNNSFRHGLQKVCLYICKFTRKIIFLACRTLQNISDILTYARC